MTMWEVEDGFGGLALFGSISSALDNSSTCFSQLFQDGPADDGTIDKRRRRKRLIWEIAFESFPEGIVFCPGGNCLQRVKIVHHWHDAVVGEGAEDIFTSDDRLKPNFLFIVKRIAERAMWSSPSKSVELERAELQAGPAVISANSMYYRVATTVYLAAVKVRRYGWPFKGPPDRNWRRRLARNG
jgi:hypothetical protein